MSTTIMVAPDGNMFAQEEYVEEGHGTAVFFAPSGYAEADQATAVKAYAELQKRAVDADAGPVRDEKIEAAIKGKKEEAQAKTKGDLNVIRATN